LEILYNVFVELIKSKKKTEINDPSLKRVEQGFDAVMTSASCNSQFLVSFRSDDIAICPMVVGDDGLYRNLHEFEIDGMFEFHKLLS
jgi:hypothetical protein